MSVQVTVRTFSPEQLSALLSFCQQQGIAYDPVPTSAFPPATLGTQNKTPVPAFKELCGAMWLNAKGQLSEQAALEFLTFYIKLHRLRQADGTIQLDSPLQTILHTLKVYEHELPSMAQRVFATSS
jgi:hypothetical protein